MTVPAPRTEVAAMPGDGALGLVISSLQRLEDSVGRLSADMRSELSRLPEQYVHRREADRRFDELMVAVGGERADRKSAIKELEDRAEEAEQRRVADRRWAIGVLFTVLGLLLTLAAFVINLAT